MNEIEVMYLVFGLITLLGGALGAVINKKIKKKLKIKRQVEMERRKQQLEEEERHEKERRRQERQVQEFVNKRERENRQTAPREQDAIQYDPYFFYKGKFDDLIHLIVKDLESKQIEKAFERITEMWQGCDPEKDARSIHTVLETLAYYMYEAYPYYRAEYLDEFVELCELDISNYANYFDATARFPDHRVFRIPTYYAITLEQNSRIDEAIEFCEYCERLNIPDHGYVEFSRRKEHLKKKKARPQTSANLK